MLVTLTVVESSVVLLLVLARSGRSPGTLALGAGRVQRGTTRAPGLGAGMLRTEAIDLRRDAWQLAEQRAERRRARAAQVALRPTPIPQPTPVAPPVPRTQTAPTAPSCQ